MLAVAQQKPSLDGAAPIAFLECPDRHAALTETRRALQSVRVVESVGLFDGN